LNITTKLKRYIQPNMTDSPKSSYNVGENTEGLMGKDPVLLIFTNASEVSTQKEVSDVLRTFADSAKEKGDTYLAKYFTNSGGSEFASGMRPAFGLARQPLRKHDKPVTLTYPSTDSVGPYQTGWVCNGCDYFGPPTEPNWRNKDGYDACEACYQKVYGEDAVTPPFEKPQMYILKFSSGLFWAPKEGEGDVTLENIQKLIDNHKAGSLVESKCIF